MKHYKIQVTGKVQGVSFRDTARKEAERLGLSGFARNEPDGSVYIEVEGDEASLRSFLQWAHEGSPEAIVTAMKHSEQPPVGHDGFEIY